MNLIHLHDYDSSYDPSMPSLAATVRGDDPASATEQAVRFIVDSGADATLIPTAILKQIGAHKSARRQMVGVTGVSVAVDMYIVVLQIGNGKPIYLEARCYR